MAITNRRSSDSSLNMEGFEVSTSGLKFLCEEGSVRVYKQNSVEDEVVVPYSTEEYNYPNFVFDVDPHEELDVMYDVYLLEEDEISIVRTEMTKDADPKYEGEIPLIYRLASFTVTPGTKDLEEINITVWHLGRNL